MLECVINVSEGRDLSSVSSIAAAAEDHLLDVHSDPDHHRSVITLAGPSTEEAARSVARKTIQLLDIRTHTGEHPRLGVLDVVPFVPLGAHGQPLSSMREMSPALQARDRFGDWAAAELRLPCFFYGPERPLPEVRRRAFVEVAPDTGPGTPHPTAGACAVGARSVLVAYNIWLSSSDVSIARSIASRVRSFAVRALGLSAAGTTQVSMNLVDPLTVGPLQVYDAVEDLAREAGVHITRTELVGLAPAALVDATPPERYKQLDLDPSRTIEGRLSVAQQS